MEDGLNALYANQIDLRGSSSSSVLKFLSRFRWHRPFLRLPRDDLAWAGRAPRFPVNHGDESTQARPVQ